MIQFWFFRAEFFASVKMGTGIHAETPNTAKNRAGKDHAKKNLNWNIIACFATYCLAGGHALADDAGGQSESFHQ